MTEKDWKLFRKRMPEWQENFMAGLNKKYIEILSRTDRNASENFWELEERIKKDYRKTGVRAEMARSKMEFNLADLIQEKAITLDDLDGFSEDVINHVKRLIDYRE